jgi:N-acetylmuramic acid 6-phosphate (MurNAc-6-P) etherase
VDTVHLEADRVDTVPPVEMTAMPAAADRVHRAVARADMVHLAVARADTVHLETDRAVLAVRPVEMIATAVEAKTALAARVVMAADNNNKVAMVVEHKAATVNKAETKAIIRGELSFGMVSDVFSSRSVERFFHGSFFSFNIYLNLGNM